MRAYKLFPEGLESCSFIIDPAGFDAFREEIDGSEAGERFVLEIIEIDQGEFDNLPEFDGF